MTYQFKFIVCLISCLVRNMILCVCGGGGGGGGGGPISNIWKEMQINNYSPPIHHPLNSLSPTGCTGTALQPEKIIQIRQFAFKQNPGPEKMNSCCLRDTLSVRSFIFTSESFDWIKRWCSQAAVYLQGQLTPWDPSKLLFFVHLAVIFINLFSSEPLAIFKAAKAST